MNLPAEWNAERFKKFSQEVEWLISSIGPAVDLHLEDPKGWPLRWLESELLKRAKLYRSFEDTGEFLETNQGKTPIRVLGDCLFKNYHELRDWIIVGSGQGFCEVARFGEVEAETAHGLALQVAGSAVAGLRGAISYLINTSGTQLNAENYSQSDFDFRKVVAQLLRERALLLRRLPVEESESISPKLNDCEETIVQTIREFGPMKGAQLAGRAGYPHNGHVKGVLSSLVKRQILNNVKGLGYTLWVRTPVRTDKE